MMEAELAALRAQGADALDALRFRQLEALARRMQAQPEDVQKVLAPRLAAGIAAYQGMASRVASQGELAAPRNGASATGTSRPDADGLGARLRAAPTPSPLAALNRHIAEQTHNSPTARQAPTGQGARLPPVDMKSVQRFREIWGRIATERQMADAIMRAPDNAGPLNSHKLMLRVLTLMQGLSPDYLSRFLTQMDALLWLHQVNQQASLKDGKAGRKGRSKK
jgi:hypothetical protein